MENIVANYYRDYVGSSEGFTNFHNQVLNMPRDDFDANYFKKLQTYASYLLLLNNMPDGDLKHSYKDIMNLIKTQISTNHIQPVFPDEEFENRYFIYDNIDEHYTNEGRMFRHVMEHCLLWGMLKNTDTPSKKTIDFDRCESFVSLKPEYVSDFVEHISLDININDNDFILSLRGIANIRPNANYHPTLGILKYMQGINRPVTDFEISVLLGRVDNLQVEDLIIERALNIGRSFQSTNRNGQRQEFFRAMQWVDEHGQLFTYGQSQQPWFKFQTYLICLQNFGLIQKNNITNNLTLTDEALKLLGNLPASILDLNRLINKLDLESGSLSDKTMKDVLIKENISTLLDLIKQETFITQVNTFSLTHPIVKEGKKYRNQFIAELAKIRENYTCQAGSTTFEGQNGRNYVEAHHIIEFSKGGPDILENLIAIGPTPHTQLHRGSDRAIRDMYINLMSRGAINYALFEKMADKYHCLTESNIDFLVSKGLISSDQQRELLSKI